MKCFPGTQSPKYFFLAPFVGSIWPGESSFRVRGFTTNLVKCPSHLVKNKEMIFKCSYFVPTVKPTLFYRIIILLLVYSGSATLYAQEINRVQENGTATKIKKASKKIASGVKNENQDTLAQGYFDLGETYYQQGDAKKSESYFQKAKTLYEKINDAEGIAKSSRALAKVQEDLNKKKEAVLNYSVAQKNNIITGDTIANILNTNDIGRLSTPDSARLQERLITDNIKASKGKKDTGEIILNYTKLGTYNLKTKNTPAALNALNNAYNFSVSSNATWQAPQINQQITDLYLKEKNFPKAIETKKQILSEGFVQNSVQQQVKEINSLADIYFLKNDDSIAISLLNESYVLSVKNGHTLQAKECIQKLDSIFQAKGQKEKSLQLYKNFLAQLPVIISKDSSLADAKVIAETETKIKELENEKVLKDDLIRRKNIFNYWLTGSTAVLLLLVGIVLYMLKKLRVRNKKIALQSLRREMNPHFIFNSLNSINQFISTNNELEANQYLTKFSTLMRRVMENSKDDFVLFSKEIELLQNYLELEKSRFPDKFDFTIKIDDTIFSDEHLYIPGMLIQPHLENAIWHGLRYMDEKGLLQLSFVKQNNSIKITIEDNGIGMEESRKHKTTNQKQHKGRGIANTLERINILNELYHQDITCITEDKPAPGTGVKVTLAVPVLKNFVHED